MDRIIIKGAGFNCHIGVSEKERAKKQEIIIDAELFFDIPKNLNDDVQNTVNYSDVHELIKNIAEKSQFKLIEALAEKIAKEILSSCKIKKITVKIIKPAAFKSKNAEYAAVEITRKNG